MDLNTYIASGILESYCLGQLTGAGCEQVEQMARTYPEISAELKAIHDSLQFYAEARSMVPHATVKTKLLLRLYEQQCGIGKNYPPLIKENITAADFKNWLADKTFTEPAVPFDNLATFDLPSTEAVTNFIVWAKAGHDEEMHSEYNEFIVILSGHCDMYFNDLKTHYNTGDIIVIPPFTPHTAVVTSAEPMVALVQRQLLAA